MVDEESTDGRSRKLVLQKTFVNNLD